MKLESLFATYQFNSEYIQLTSMGLLNYYNGSVIPFEYGFNSTHILFRNDNQSELISYFHDGLTWNNKLFKSYKKGFNFKTIQGKPCYKQCPYESLFTCKKQGDEYHPRSVCLFNLNKPFPI